MFHTPFTCVGYFSIPRKEYLRILYFHIIPQILYFFLIYFTKNTLSLLNVKKNMFVTPFCKKKKMKSKNTVLDFT